MLSVLALTTNNVMATANTTAEAVNETIAESSTGKDFLQGFHLDIRNTGALLRGFYVVAAATVILFLYMVVRSFRTKQSSRVRKYGVKARRGDTEITPLGQDEDEDDLTIFEMPPKNRR